MNTNDIELTNIIQNAKYEFIQDVIKEPQRPSANFSSQKKHNRKLYPIYKMFSWDLFFYYPIIFLFLTVEKGWSASQILLVDSFYPLFKIIANFPNLAISDKLGKRKSLIFGNIMVSLAILSIILASQLRHIILANLLFAIGYTIKNLCESSLLHECIEYSKNANSQFSKISSKGSAFHYIFDAVSSIATGFLFVYNHYLPLFICLFICILTILLAFSFDEYTNRKQKNIAAKEKKRFNFNYIEELFASFSFIFHSQRLRALLLFSGLFTGVLSIRNTIYSSLFTEISLPEQYFGIMFALLQLISCFGSVNQNYFHKKYRNKLLTHFSLNFSLSMILLGIIVILNLSFIPTLIVVILLCSIQYLVKGPYYILIQRYLNSFSTQEISTKIYTTSSIVESIFGVIITLSASFLLEHFSTSYAILIIGIIMFILFIVVLEYMKPRLGLKPEEYEKKDIEYISPNTQTTDNN